MTVQDPAYFLNEAFKSINFSDARDYPKSREAQVRSAVLVAKAAAEINSGAQPKRSLYIQYASEEEGRGWNDYLITARGYQRRDMTSSGSGIGGVSPLMPLGFYTTVTHARKLTDQLFDPAVSTIIRTATGTPTALPMDFDVNAAATVVNENQQGTTTDPVMGMVALPQSPTWRTSVYISVEFLRDSGIPLDLFLALIFAVRYARGFGQSLVSTLLSGAAQTTTVAGAGASDQTMAGQTAAGSSIGSDDLVALMESLDGAHLLRSSWCMAPKTFLSLMGLRGSTGNLVFTPERDEQDRPLLLSRPVIFSPSMPGIGSATRSIVLGDFSRLIIREGSSMTLQASAERRPETGSIFYWSTWRLQGAVSIDPALPAGSDKPFVTFSGALQTAASEAHPAKAEGGTPHGFGAKGVRK